MSGTHAHHTLIRPVWIWFRRFTNSSDAPVSATHVVSWCGEAVLEEMMKVAEGIKGISNDTNMADVE